MAGLLTAAILILLAVRIFGHGVEIEIDELIGLPQLIALLAVGLLLLLIFLRSPGGEAAAGMTGLAVCGLLLVLFPERMPDTQRGGTLMTTFWGVFGGLLIAVAWGVVLVIRYSSPPA